MIEIKQDALHQVAGGTLFQNARVLTVDTTGIPDYCVGQFDFLLQLVFNNDTANNQIPLDTFKESFDLVLYMSGCAKHVQDYVKLFN